MIYDDKVTRFCLDRKFSGRVEGGASGVEIELQCGTFVEFAISTDEHDEITARYRSNGCGYMIASAELLARNIDGRNLASLGGLDREKISEQCRESLSNEITSDRSACVSAAAEALLRAFSALREQRIAQKSLGRGMICSCFGITEARIQADIIENDLYTVDEVADANRAGTGCGSCRMLIQELLDHRQ